jgi:hypothetical protein
MRKLIILFLLVFVCFGILRAQNSKVPQMQNLRGTVIDADTKSPLIGVSVVTKNTEETIGTISDENGNFLLENLPIGRIVIEASFTGYQSEVLNNILLVPGKETMLVIELIENSIKLDEIVVKPDIQKNKSDNQLAMVSSRKFLVEETSLYAGSIGDPARMVRNYAGVMSIDDSRNDIVIRGNSPNGLLWRVDGFDVPNPNHYSMPGSTGGPMSMLNNNNLANSDFLTSAFPAEFGNALSGVFDLKLRNGNTNKREHVFQIATSGFELGTEGPINRDKSSSYIINYRYSAPEIFDILGLWDKAIVPKYQDVTFKINLPKTNIGNLQIFGMGGLNSIVQDCRKLDEKDWTYGLHNAVMSMDNKMAVLGITNTVYLGEKTRWITKISGQYSDNFMRIDTVVSAENSILREKLGMTELKGTFQTELKNKLNAKNFFDIGFSCELTQLKFLSQEYPIDGGIPEFYTDMDELTSSASAFFQYRYRLTNSLSLTTGGRYFQFITNHTDSKEARAAIEQKIGNRNVLSFGFGMHSKKQDNVVYFLESYNRNTNNYVETNKNLELTKSKHYVVTFNSLITTNLNLKLETYYQDLFNVPVSLKNPQYSMLNYGGAFEVASQDSLINSGTGRNYGIELTLEKYLDRNFYFLLTGSLFESKYKGFDQIERNTEFNGNYIGNALFGCDFKIFRKYSLGFNVRGVYSGGKRKLPIDLDASIDKGEVIYDWENAYKQRFPDYYRLDARISIKAYHKKATEELAIDITNVTDYRKNIINEYYNSLTNTISADYQEGIQFNILYKIYF